MVEDEYLLADDISRALADAGAQVLGPVASAQDAEAIIGSEERIDAAVLDVNLRDGAVFPAADALAAREIPFAFATGYEEWSLPERFQGRPLVEKPFKASQILDLLAPMTPRTDA
ncbi:CheY-like chemotaxis protein [Sphingopyxis sp. OAS728]|uniref:response regulator n=1 Tax=Sphingopyxis sp. OAS728 TaxID=2663823 RepID=UPI0019DAC4A6|nr:response regulator [Sphingopyxis sp. OAS728]MBE1529450.1 CheY-like chemotaxis protein [Sphingopyxis sp. OAS728]